jgi:hypothetical protein
MICHESAQHDSGTHTAWLLGGLLVVVTAIVLGSVLHHNSVVWSSAAAGNTTFMTQVTTHFPQATP